MSAVEIAARYLSPAIKSWNFAKKPLIIGVSGPQGSGKSWLSENLQAKLQEEYQSLNIVNISIDDFYLTHGEQKGLVHRYPNCGLITDGRGLPGTHSVDLLLEVFRKIQQKEIHYKIPKYDKSKFSGEGDRAPIEEWTSVQDRPLDVVLFEGWFVGFAAVPSQQEIGDMLIRRWKDALRTAETPELAEKLEKVNYQNILMVNKLLPKYQSVWNKFDRFIYFATSNLTNVYAWRLEQEKALINAKGTGMTDAEVKAFVDRYYPIYKMYYGNMVNNGVVKEKDANLKIEIDINRAIAGVTKF